MAFRPPSFRRVCSLASFLTLVIAGNADAQRVDENATAQAEDAFGIAISGQNLGLYDPSNVRGFSPTAAGNVRLDGMYFANQAGFTSRLIGGYRILVGPSVLGHPFPAPSGIADYSLRRPGTRDLVSVSAQVDSFSGRLIEVDGQLHDVLPDLGFTGGFGLYRNAFGRGGGNDTFSSALTAVWRPSPKVEIIPFFSRIADRDDRSEPVVVLAGNALPAEPRSTAFLGQRWAASQDTSMNYGALGRVDLGAWRLRASAFRSQDQSPIAFTPLFVDTLASGVADRAVISERGAFAGATSGELQLSRTMIDGPRKHRVYLAAWGRNQDRRYGATDTVTLSSADIYTPQPSAMPALVFGSQTRDHVRQLTVGAAYEGQWTGVGALNLGIQKTDYQKSVTTPDGALPTSRDKPVLYNASGAINLAKSVTLYAGVAHGLEESDVAPSIAVNRNQAPPAIRTSQVDGGVRWALAPHVSLVADVFQIRKPYYGLDDNRVFRNLGTISHRGVEVSLAGSPLTGLSVVAGAVGLDAAVSGEQVDAGTVGKRPVGSTPTIFIGSVDYRLPQLKALSFDANVERDGRRVATVDDQLYLPSRTYLSAGMRYRFKVASKPAVLRLQASNLTDVFSWGIVGSGALQPQSPRQFLARLTTDI